MVAAKEGETSVIADEKGTFFQNIAPYFEKGAISNKRLNMLVLNFYDPTVSYQWNILDECFDYNFKILDVEKTRELINDILQLFNNRFDTDFSNVLLFSVLLSYYRNKYKSTKEKVYEFEVSDVINILKNYKEYTNEFRKIAPTFEVENLCFSLFYEKDTTKIDEQIDDFISCIDENRMEVFFSKGLSCSEVSTRQGTYFIIYDEDDEFSNQLTFLFLKYVWKNAIRQRNENPENQIPLKFFAKENIGKRSVENYDKFKKMLDESQNKHFQIWDIND